MQHILLLVTLILFLVTLIMNISGTKNNISGTKNNISMTNNVSSTDTISVPLIFLTFDPFGSPYEAQDDCQC